jgi:hypothetical protein
MKTKSSVFSVLEVTRRCVAPFPARCIGIGVLVLVFSMAVVSAANNKAGITPFNTPPLAPVLLTQVGTIGIISTSTIPQISIQRPLMKEEALAEARGGADDCMSGVETRGRLRGVITPKSQDPVSLGVASATLSPFLVAASVDSLVGQTLGAFRGVPAKKFRAADAAITRFANEVNLQESLRQQVWLQARGATTHPVTLVRKPFPAGQEREFSRMSCVMAGTLAWVPDGQTPATYLLSQGVDTALEVQLIHPALRSEGVINPPLAFCAEVRARLRRVADGQEFFSCALRYRSPRRKFVEWATDDARPLREEVERFCQVAAFRIVDQLSLHSWPATKPMDLATTVNE